MKGKLLIAAGLLSVGAALYYYFTRKPNETPVLERENDKHHLTNAFSRAKEVALGN